MKGKISRCFLLLPLSVIYGLIVCVRNFLYEKKILKTALFDLPVISIGNIAAGGTGKTPHTEFLLSVLNKQFNCATLSRGYKRQTKGYFEATNNTGYKEIGDEPLQIYRKFSNVVVAVDEKRVNGITRLKLNHPEIDLIILDDAFQHRQITPSLSILLTSYNRLFTKDFLLPFGFLREGRHNYARADIVIVTKCPERIKNNEIDDIKSEIKIQKHQQIFFSGLVYSEPLALFGSNFTKKISLNNLKKNKYTVLIVTGIASNNEFVEKIAEFCHDYKVLTFADHRNFNLNDIRKIENTFINIQSKNKLIITTEKDAVRISESSFIQDSLKAYIYYITIKIKILEEKEETFIKTITNHVRKN